MFVNNDPMMVDAAGQHAKARNTNLNEDLGKVGAVRLRITAAIDMDSHGHDSPDAVRTDGRAQQESCTDIFSAHSPESIICLRGNLCLWRLMQVAYVFSDKTGTLTSNEMQLRQIAIEGTAYGRADFR